MPYPDLKTSVCCLDPKRLGNQIYREAKTLISGGWPNHPAAKIWTNHKHALATYCLFGLEELRERGRYYPKWYDYFAAWARDEPDTGLPPIIGHEAFHSGHRAALLAKGLIDETWRMSQNASQCPNFLRNFPKKLWTWEEARALANFLGDWPTTWYSQFGWTETPEPDTKKAYIWSLT